MDGRGVRCVSTGEWVTAAETAECVLALDALGRDDAALELLTWVQALRNEDGSYWTGMVYPEEATYPPARAILVHGRRHDPGGRRAQPDHPGLGNLPGRGSARAISTSPSRHPRHPSSRPSPHREDRAAAESSVVRGART